MQSIKIFITGWLILTIIHTGISGQENENVNIRGVVIDAATNKPVAGANVTCLDVSAAITDSVGIFSMEVPSLELPLVIKADGYQDKIIPVKKDSLTISLFDPGYRSFSQTSKTYDQEKPGMFENRSVTTIYNNGSYWKKPSVTFEKRIQGVVPGLSVRPISGMPGARSSMLLRGASSLYLNTSPLIIIDGMIYNNQTYGNSVLSGFAYNPLAYIEINDIENITVVKDASSLYGAKAGNGVIYIQTRHSEQMETKIDLIAYGGMNNSPGIRYKMLDNDEYKTYLTGLLCSRNLSSEYIRSLPYMIEDDSYSEYYRYHNNTDWQDLMYEDSYINNFNLRISGGDNVALYALSLGYLSNDGIIKNTNVSRYTLRFNSDITISNQFSVNANIGFAYLQQHLPIDGYDTIKAPVFLSLVKSPFLHPYKLSSAGVASPNFEDADIFGIGNPLALIDDMSSVSTDNRIFGSFDFHYAVNKNITISDLVGFSFDKKRDNLFVPHLGVVDDTTDFGVIENTMAQQVDRNIMFTNDLRIKYNRVFNHVHNFHAIAGFRTGSDRLQEDYGIGHNSPNDETRSIGTGDLELNQTGGFISSSTWLTYYAALDYDFKSRYFLTANMALDGTSRVGEKADGLSLFHHKFGFFPSIAAGWLVSSEDFFSGIHFIDLLKLRLSYGVSGNDNIGDYQSKKYYVSQNFYSLQGLVMGNLWNPYLQYETVRKLNGGIDLSLFNERLLLTADVYQHITDNLVNYKEADIYSGFSEYYANDGKIKNTGIELMINTRLINKELYQFDIGFNIDKNRSEVVGFPGQQRITKIHDAEILTAVGQPLGVFYGYKTDGVYSTTEEAESDGLSVLMPNTDLIPLGAGDVKFVDGGNRIIDDNDKQIIGDPNPDFTGMFFTRISVRGFTLDASLFFSYGNEVYNFVRHQLESMKNYYNQTETMLNRWQAEGQETNVPRAVWNDPVGNSRFSDRWIEDGSFIRLKSVTLSYDIPLKRVIKDMRIFVTGENLLTWTSYLGMDPEFGYFGNSLNRGIDTGLMPQTMKVYAGIKLGL
ncbi:MAG: SusC/RagA family TonB-linked outer membrane protein [Bacteroidales bacterium]|nr:SusC/RagA family TonB-linked outer membrane protein [Bacteroidales bacterium]